MKEDQRLIDNYFRRRPDAVEMLYDRHAPALLSLCYRYAGNMQDAEDILHNGFIKILKNLQEFNPRHENSLEAWMKRIMTNTALNFIRDHIKERRIVDIDRVRDEIGLNGEEDSEHDFESFPVSQEEILQMVGELPTGYRTVFNLYVFEEYSHKAIAEALSCTESTSKSQLYKARALLRARISEKILIHNNR